MIVSPTLHLPPFVTTRQVRSTANSVMEEETVQQKVESKEEEVISALDRNDILVCSTHGNIYAVRKSNFSRLWKVKSPSGATGGVTSILVTENDKLIVGANGKTSRMDLFTGRTLWSNKMLGFGNEEVSIITTPPMAPPEGESWRQDIQLVIACSRGKVMAIDIETGNTTWTYSCPGVWFNIPVVIIEPAPGCDKENPTFVVYVGAGQWIFSLEALTGTVINSSRISDSKPELNYMTLATPWSSRLAAESHTAFSQNPVAQVRSIIRHRN